MSSASEAELLEACMSLQAEGMDELFHDLDEPQMPQRRGSSSSDEEGVSSALLFAPPASAPSNMVARAPAGQQQAQAGRSQTHSAPNNIQLQLPRAFSEPPESYAKMGNCYPAPANSTWFGSSEQQQQQQRGGRTGARAGEGAVSEVAFGSGLNLGRMYSDTSSQVPQQQWHPASAGDVQHGSLSMLQTDAGAAAARRRSPSLDTASPHNQGHPLTPLLASLTVEQQQMLVNAGMDPYLLLPTPRTPTPTPATPGGGDPQLDTAEAVWQHVAASGADDQTLLALAAGLGLISMDSNTGSVVLTREMALLQQQRNAAGMHSPPAPTSARHSMFGGGNSPPHSSPLPRLSQPGLASLLGLQGTVAGMRMSLGSALPTVKGLGSPGPSKQHTLYKTELCRGWIETGTCRYGSKCQFAHGREELRPVPRHPKYKTEVCRSFTATGVCAYGPRCRFIHGVASAPSNAIFDCPGAFSMQRNDGGSGMEGVLGFDDLAPTASPGSVNDASLGNGGGGPRKQLLAALSGAPALRQAAGSAATATAQDAAAMARMAARLFSAGGRNSLDSAMSMGTAARNSYSDANRNSMDSRAGGTGAGNRMSLESCMSQSEIMNMMASGATSNDRLNGDSGDMQQRAAMYGSPAHHASLTTDSLLSLSASLAAVAGNNGTHQPFMPGIPEGRAMNINTLPVDPWAGIPTAHSHAQQMQQQQRLSGDGNTFLLPFGFPRVGGNEANDSAGFMLGNLNNAPGGNWWDPATASAAGKQRPVAEQVTSSAQHMSAYKSNLYAINEPVQHQHGGAGKMQPSPRGSYPGLPTPEKSETSIEPTSDNQLGQMPVR